VTEPSLLDTGTTTLLSLDRRLRAGRGSRYVDARWLPTEIKEAQLNWNRMFGRELDRLRPRAELLLPGGDDRWSAGQDWWRATLPSILLLCHNNSSLFRFLTARLGYRHIKLRQTLPACLRASRNCALSMPLAISSQITGLCRLNKSAANQLTRLVATPQGASLLVDARSARGAT